MSNCNRNTIEVKDDTRATYGSINVEGCFYFKCLLCKGGRNCMVPAYKCRCSEDDIELHHTILNYICEDDAKIQKQIYTTMPFGNRNQFTDVGLVGENAVVSTQMVRDARVPKHYTAGSLTIPTGYTLEASGNLTPIIPPGLPSDIKGQLISTAHNLERRTKVNARLQKKLAAKLAAKAK